jgi:hypothetical protein
MVSDSLSFLEANSVFLLISVYLISYGNSMVPLFSRFFYSTYAVLSVDAIDMSGKHEVDLDTNIWKVG